MKKDIERIKVKEAVELKKWEKEVARKSFAGYLVLIVIICALIRLVDEFVTSAGSSMQSAIAVEYFPNLSFAEAISSYSIVGTALLVFSIFATIFATFADKWGRKKVLIISTLGMAFGMLVCAWSPNFAVHLIGRAIIAFFISTDFHAIYIMEVSPDKKRSSFVAVASVLGYLGVMLVSFGRGLFTENELLNWRGVYLMPAFFAVLLGVLLLIFGRETKVFLDNRIKYLRKPIEERKLEAKEHKSNSNNLGKAFRFIFKHKQPRILVIAGIFQNFAIMAYYGFYESIMTESGLTTTETTQALLMYPIASALCAVLIGWLGDKVGRKFSCIVSSLLAFSGLILFIMACIYHWNPYMIGLLYGYEIGSFWAFGNNMGLAFSETIPTDIRSSCAAARGLIAVAVSIVAAISINIMIAVFNNINIVCLIWGALFLGVSIIIYATKAKETNGADLNAVISD